MNALPDGKVLIPSAGGYTADQLMQKQHQTNQAQAHAAEAAKLRYITVRTAVQDVRDALQGTLSDLWGNTEPLPLSQLCTQGNRLRGLGLLLVMLAAAGLLLNAFIA